MSIFPYRIISKQLFRNGSPISNLIYRVQKYRRDWKTLFFFKNWKTEKKEVYFGDELHYEDRTFNDIEAATSYVESQLNYKPVILTEKNKIERT